MRSRRAWASSGNPLRGLAIASIPAPAFAQDNIVATATLPVISAPGHVHHCRRGGEGGLGRPCLRIFRYLDGLACEDDRDRDLQAPRAGGLNILAGVTQPRKAWSGSRYQGRGRQFLDAAVTELKLSAGAVERDGIKERIASRSSASKRPTGAAFCAAPASWRPSVPPLPSWACSALFGAS